MGNKLAENNFLIYEGEEGKINVDVILKDETIWLTQKSMANLFDTNIPNISKHLTKIFIEEELIEKEVVSKMEIPTKHGAIADKIQIIQTNFYNLDAIIAVGYRVNSKKATSFRKWATKTLKEYIIKGFAIDKERLKNGTKFGKDYFDELLTVIKEIRLSERRVYQKITDLFETTSIDYNKDSEEAYTFFKIVQNKLHYAITGKTAAELIFERVDSKEISMGLTSWKNSPDGKILKYDISIAKNYLKKDEIEKLDDLTEMFLVVAETEVKERRTMTMQDWIETTDKLLKYRDKNILINSGNVSHKKAIDKANEEYDKFRIIQDEKYLSSMDELYKKYLDGK